MVFTRSFWATLGGLLTAVVVALGEEFNFDDFNIKSVKSWFKLFAIILPIIGGYLSKIKSKDDGVK